MRWLDNAFLGGGLTPPTGRRSESRLFPQAFCLRQAAGIGKRCQASALKRGCCRVSPKSYPNLVGYIHPAVRLRVSANKTPIPKSSQMPTNSGANITGDGGNGTIDL